MTSKKTASSDLDILRKVHATEKLFENEKFKGRESERVELLLRQGITARIMEPKQSALRKLYASRREARPWSAGSVSSGHMRESIFSQRKQSNNSENMPPNDCNGASREDNHMVRSSVRQMQAFNEVLANSTKDVQVHLEQNTAKQAHADVASCLSKMVHFAPLPCHSSGETPSDAHSPSRPRSPKRSSTWAAGVDLAGSSKSVQDCQVQERKKRSVSVPNLVENSFITRSVVESVTSALKQHSLQSPWYSNMRTSPSSPSAATQPEPEAKIRRAPTLASHQTAALTDSQINDQTMVDELGSYIAEAALQMSNCACQLRALQKPSRSAARHAAAWRDSKKTRAR